MKAEELWAAYVAKNPSFADPDANITMTARGLKRLFDQTYERGHEQGVRNGRAMAEMEAAKKPSGDSFYERMFGKDLFKRQ